MHRVFLQMIWLRRGFARITRSLIASEVRALKVGVEHVKRDILRNSSVYYLEAMVLQVHLTLQSHSAVLKSQDYEQ